MQLPMEETTTNQVRTGFVDGNPAGSNRFPDLLTVGQASQYLHAKGLDRTTKTIRKWCRLEHIETKSNTIPGGPKWLIVRSTLDAKIEEEKVIEAALKQKTGSYQFEPVRVETSSNQSEPVYNHELVKTLAQQIIEKDKQLENAHSREIELTKIIASQNEKHHELARDMAQLGITIGNALRLNSGDGGSNRSGQDQREEVRAKVAENEAPTIRTQPPAIPTPSAAASQTSSNHAEPGVRQYEEPRYDDRATARTNHPTWNTSPDREETTEAAAFDEAEETWEPPVPPSDDRQQPMNHHDPSEVEYPPRYGNFQRDRQGDNATPHSHQRGVQ